MPNESWGKAGEEYCKTLIKILELEADTKEKYNSLKGFIVEQLKLLGGFFADIGDITGAELISAAGELASNMVSNLTSVVDGATSAILERILSSILEILLSGPEVLLALIGLPLKEARTHADDELKYILSARRNLTLSIGILSKWLSGIGGEKYYVKMRAALPAIEKALLDMSAMIRNLDTTEDKSPYFSRITFNRIVSNLEQAIVLSEPESVVSKYSNNSKVAAEKKREYINRETLKLRNEWYTPKKNTIDQNRKDKIKEIKASYFKDLGYGEVDLQALTSVGEINPLQTPITVIDAAWESAIETLDTEFEVRKQKILLEAAEIESETLIKEAISRGADKFLTEFNNDMARLKKYLILMLKDVKDASKSNGLCQVYTNATYKAVDSVKQWIRWFIDLAASAGGGAADVASEAFEISHSITESARDLYEEDIEAYNEDDISTSKMSVDLIVGNSQLKIAQSILNGTITESLEGIINLDEFLGNEAKKFRAFQDRLAEIPDFDGKPNVWAVDLAESKLVIGNPYLGLVANIASLISAAPKSLSSSKASDKARVRKAFSKTNRDFSVLLKHNSIVRSAINSYSPYQSEKTNVVKRLLDNLGFSYLKYAFLALSVADFIKGIAEGVYSFADHALDCLETNYINTLSTKDYKKYKALIEDDQNRIFGLINLVGELQAIEALPDYKKTKAEAEAISAFDTAENQEVLERPGVGLEQDNTNNELYTAESENE